MNSKHYKPGTKLRIRHKEEGRRWRRGDGNSNTLHQWRKEVARYGSWTWPDGFDLDNYYFFKAPPR